MSTGGVHFKSISPLLGVSADVTTIDSWEGPHPRILAYPRGAPSPIPASFGLPFILRALWHSLLSLPTAAPHSPPLSHPVPYLCLPPMTILSPHPLLNVTQNLLLAFLLVTELIHPVAAGGDCLSEFLEISSIN